MKALKFIAILLVVYVAIVAGFESMIGYFQPQAGTTLVITTTDANGKPHERVVAKLVSNGALYVAANHWPRAWYRQALANPNVTVTTNGQALAHLAVPVSPEEHERVNRENPHGILFRILTGFPPRYFLRLDPATP